LARLFLFIFGLGRIQLRKLFLAWFLHNAQVVPIADFENDYHYQ